MPTLYSSICIYIYLAAEKARVQNHTLPGKNPEPRRIARLFPASVPELGHAACRRCRHRRMLDVLAARWMAAGEQLDPNPADAGTPTDDICVVDTA